MNIKDELILFNKVNSSEKVIKCNHNNFMYNDKDSSAIYSQGIGRGKLRVYKKQNKLTIEDFLNKKVEE